MNESEISNLYLRLYPDAVLRCQTSPCPIDIDYRTLLANKMIELMIDHNGLGLSAPQVGIEHSVFVMRHPIGGDGGQTFFNPKIINHGSDKETMSEGCLSLLGKTVTIQRFKDIILQFELVDGSVSTRAYKDLEARCIQHEVDHLNGILIFDHINSELARKLFLEKYQKVKKRYVRIG